MFLRTLGWERVAEDEYARMEPSMRAILVAYADGVNAYLANHNGSAVSLEYAFLPLINQDYDPLPWTPINTLTYPDLGQSHGLGVGQQQAQP